jgi:hypothetical protein
VSLPGRKPISSLEESDLILSLCFAINIAFDVFGESGNIPYCFPVAYNKGKSARNTPKRQLVNGGDILVSGSYGSVKLLQFCAGIQ